MNKDLLFDSLKAVVVMDFSRSGGPGGQNVNKLNTKVTAKVAIGDVYGLSEAERRRVAEKLANRMDSDGILSIQVQDERSQWANRTRALERLFDLITSAAKRTPPRIPTKPGKAAKERRLATKKGAQRGQARTAKAHPGLDRTNYSGGDEASCRPGRQFKPARVSTVSACQAAGAAISTPDLTGTAREPHQPPTAISTLGRMAEAVAKALCTGCSRNFFHKASSSPLPSAQRGTDCCI